MSEKKVIEINDTCQVVIDDKNIEFHVLMWNDEIFSFSTTVKQLKKCLKEMNT